MQVTVYNFREYDEKVYFEQYAKELGITLVTCPDAPTLENIGLAKGSECIDILTSKMTPELIAALAQQGVRYITTRTIGYDHIDMKACKEHGITVGNAPYGPNGVADYTVMLLLMSIRKAKQILQRTNIQDYTLKGNLGRELKDMTVGVIGTGRIGKTVIQNLSGFGCKMIAYDLYESDEVKKYADYVSLDEIWAQADIISLHTPLTDDNFHLINADTIAKMKDGVILINTARGPLVEADALLEAIESGKIGAAGLDVVENEFGLYYYDRKNDVLDNRELALLRSYPNVTVTHHMAFYTDNCVKTVVADSLKSCVCFVNGEKNPWQVS